MVSCVVIGAWAFEYKPVWLSNLRLKMNQAWWGRTIVILGSHISVWSPVYLRTRTYIFDPSESFWYSRSHSDESHWYIANTCWSYQPLILRCSEISNYYNCESALSLHAMTVPVLKGIDIFGKKTDRFASALKNLPCMLLSTHLWKLHNRSWWVES